MRILVDFQIEKSLEPRLIGDNVIYRPDLDRKGPGHLGKTLAALAPDVLVTCRVPDIASVAKWVGTNPAFPVFIICIGDDTQAIQTVSGVPLYWVPVQGELNAAERALVLTEQLHSRQLDEACNRAIRDARAHRRHLPREHVVLVGAGAINLITAYYLRQQRYRVSVIDANPDPRTTSEWLQFGCTHGGCDGRMFSLSESRYHLANYQNAYAEPAQPFQDRIADDGWLCQDRRKLSYGDLEWIAEYTQTPTWLTSVLNEDIISFNRQSAPLWETLKKDCPSLFDGVGYTPTVLRAYSTQEQFAAAQVNEERLGALKRILDPASLCREYPGLAQAVQDGAIVGALEVVGFTVGIHRFSAKLLGLLEDAGVDFRWNQRVTAIEKDAGGEVRCLLAGDEAIAADHYVISPGAYGGSLLNGMVCGEQISGIVGAWVSLPNTEPRLAASMKISRVGFAASGAAEGANVIVDSSTDGEFVHISSGHGYVGRDCETIDMNAVEELFRVVDDTARRYFPAAYDAAQRSGLLASSRRYCVRPWTPSGLGIFEMAPTRNGGVMVVTGGHNTGGFAQSPSVAMAVLAALRGEVADMHRAYHPQRLRRFLTDGAARYRGAPVEETAGDVELAFRDDPAIAESDARETLYQ